MPKPETTKGERMPAATSSLIVTGIAGKKLVENIATDLYELAKSGFEQKIKKWKANNHADTIYKRVRQLRLVKTIWQLEKEIDLTSFYYPTKFVIDEKRVAVHQFSDFEYDGNILIEGTVGQGKSILLRYLASVDFCVSRRVPVFIELRRVRQGQTLISMALQEVKALGFEMDEQLFRFFADQGRLLLLLDAFDEVKEELRQDVISELDSLLREHEALRVLVTSRPESGIASCPLLRVFYLSPLEGKEYEAVINLMAHNPTTATAIINGIRKDAAQVAKVLTTPLMVALLMVRYKIDQSIPQNNAAFYDSLFTLLLQRHDKMKGGYVRPRKSGVSDTELLNFFNSLCFLTRKINETSFSTQQLASIAREASALIGQRCSIDKILADIIEITCLLITDGQECKFIHKSVQEYHAALFIKDQPDEISTAFYVAMNLKWGGWRQELIFLETIDRYRFLKHFNIPQLRDVLNVQCASSSGYVVQQQRIVEVCGEDKLEFDVSNGESRMFIYYGSGKFWSIARLIEKKFSYPGEMFRIYRKDVTHIFEEDGIDSSEVSVNQLLSNGQSKAQHDCDRLFKCLCDELKAAEQFVTQMESRKSALTF